ncbi:MAG: heavy metal translocating P-type ATPase [Gammaproteobacteria bacterium]|jgi:Cd2+/Zn2+-exporting ATPase|nr:heavy metal translocating P-type ATPase [Sideroxydans sp.]MBU3903919.1 heavy metal translocating P-type ATPase [Gammaproteobacteria bacterium]MBU4044801.1 heavy metal translocating P-type ATPase [Gammaproteobacteria bacterium]MBU4151075.1 heavy metal translocating P-type ATPase [Gammaproteobacteria bacterium]
MKQSIFVISNMDCPTEEALIRKRLGSVSGIGELSFNLMARRLTVMHTLDDDQAILDALSEIGMKTGAGQQCQSGSGSCSNCEVESPVVSRRTWLLMALSGTAAIAAEVVAWSGASEQSVAVIALALLSIATGGLSTLKKGWIALKTFTLNMNFLMSVAVFGAIIIGEWPEAAVVIFLFALAELIESLSLERAKNAIKGLMGMTPAVATVQLNGGEWREMAAADIRVGQTVRVRPGERIPLDGVVTAGGSSVNQAPITGESIPVVKAAGDPVFAGTLNERGMLEFRVTANKGNTTLDRIIHTVQEAQGQRAPTQRFVDQFARYYTPAVVVFAVLVAILPPLLFGAAFDDWFYKALVMLVIACPCALVISTPVTVVSGLAAAARQGILIKGGAHLENGRLIKAVALDKTGTLTHGRPVVTDVIPLVDLPADSLLQLAASVDMHSEHPIAAAIVSAWQNGGKTERTLLPSSSFESITGRGAKAVVDGQLYYVGNHRQVEELGICGVHVEEVLHRLEKEGKTAVVLSTATEPLCIIGVADTVRGHSAEAIRQLHELGVKSAMLTGDNQTTASAIAAEVGIDDARGNLLPEEKLAAIDELISRYGKVGMVGDGINDAPALAKASIGFAMGSAGTDTAIETADVALMDDDLRKVPHFIQLSRDTSRVLRQNIALAIGIKAVFFILALAGQATLWMAVFADMGASLIVVFNGMRLLRITGSHAYPPE